MKKRKVLILVPIIVVLLFIIIIGSVGVKIINANPINYLKPVNWEKAILEFSKVISIDNKYEEDIEELNLTEDSNLSEESLDKSNEVIDEVNNDKIDSEVEQIIPEEERKRQEKIVINLIVEDIRHITPHRSILVGKYHKAIKLSNQSFVHFGSYLVG